MSDPDLILYTLYIIQTQNVGNGDLRSLRQVLPGCLVDGRGSLPSPGWEITNYEDWEKKLNLVVGKGGNLRPAERSKLAKFSVSQLSKAIRNRVVQLLGLAVKLVFFQIIIVLQKNILRIYDESLTPS